MRSRTLEVKSWALSPRASSVAALLWLMLNGDALAEPVSAASLAVDDATHTNLAPHAVYLRDPTGLLEVNDLPPVSRSGKWKKVPGGMPSFGFDDATYWLHFKLPAAPNPTEWVLEIGNPLLDVVDLYAVRDAALVYHYASGDRRPFAERPMESRTFAFPLPGLNRGPLDMFLRIRSTTSLQIPIMLWPHSAFAKAENRAAFWYAAYFGLIAGMIGYNLFLLLMLRDLSYLYYVFFIASTALCIAILGGFAYAELWPEAPGWNERALPAAVFALVLFATLFMRSLLRLALYLPILRVPVNALIALAGVLLLGSMLIPYDGLSLHAAILAFVASVACMLTGLAMLTKDYRPARYFALAWGVFLSSAVLFIAAKLRLIDAPPLINLLPLVASAIETMLLAFGLASRFNLVKEQAQAAERKRLATIAEEQARRMAALRTLITGIAHRLNTPLGTGLMATSLLADKSRSMLMDTDQVKDRSSSEFARLAARSAGLAQESFQRSADLVTRFKRIVAVGDAKNRDFDLQSWIDSTLSGLSAQLSAKGISLQWTSGESVPCHGDPTLISEVVSELVNNAAQHAFECEGEIKTVEVFVSAGADDAEIEVRDSGSGLEHGELSRVMEPFYAGGGKTGGPTVGLGLYIVYSIVTEGLGGSVAVLSGGPGTGLTVRLRFPRVFKERAEVEENSVPGSVLQ